MLRCGQMVLGQALIILHLGKFHFYLNLIILIYHLIFLLLF